MAGDTTFPTTVDVFSANTPTPTSTTTATADSTGRKHAERHDDAEAALMAVETFLKTGVAYTTDLGAVTGGSPVTVTHNLGTYDVAVQIVEKGTAGAGAAAGTVVDATVALTTANALTVTFTNSADANLYRVTVLAVGATALPATVPISSIFLLGGL
jgi:hypothetical protein